MKAKRFLAMLLMGCLAVLTLFSFVGCGEKEPQVTVSPAKGIFYTLEEAYENGWLTKKDLKSIAYYYNNYHNDQAPEPNFKLIPKQELSKEKIEEMKRAYLQQNYIQASHPNATTDHVTVFQYYGTYNGNCVTFMLDDLFGYDLHFEAEKEIGGSIFYDYVVLKVYYINI